MGGAAGVSGSKGLRGVAYALRTRRGERPQTGLAAIERALEPGEHVEASGYCTMGHAEAGFAALTNRRIVFAPRRGALRFVPYTEVTGVHDEAWLPLCKRVRVALGRSRPLHLVTGIAADPSGVIRSHR